MTGFEISIECTPPILHRHFGASIDQAPVRPPGTASGRHPRAALPPRRVRCQPIDALWCVLSVAWCGTVFDVASCFGGRYSGFWYLSIPAAAWMRHHNESLEARRYASVGEAMHNCGSVKLDLPSHPPNGASWHSYSRLLRMDEHIMTTSVADQGFHSG